MRRDDQTDPPVGGGLSTVDGALAGLDAALDRLGGLDLGGVGSVELVRLAKGLTRAVGRVEGLRARTVTAAEAGTAVRDAGAVDGGQWLSSVTGSTPHAAARAKALGQAMDAVPELADAVSSGAVDGEQAATLAAAAARGVLDGADVAVLVETAKTMPAGALAREAKRQERRRDQTLLARDEGHARRRRRAKWWWNDDGTFRIDGHLDGIAGRMVETALEALNLPDPAEVPDEARRTPDQRRADALADLARLSLEAGRVGTVRSVKPHVSVVVSPAMLAADAGDAERAGAVGVLDDGSAISAELTRKVLCDATVRRVVVDPAGMPLDVGRATRVWSAAQRTASRAVDGGCRGPGCDRPFEWTDLHHVVWWRDGGTTGIDNGLPLCGHDHDLVHHDGWMVELDPTTRVATWTAPSGRTHVTYPRGPAAPLDLGGRP